MALKLMLFVCSLTVAGVYGRNLNVPNAYSAGHVVKRSVCGLVSDCHTLCVDSQCAFRDGDTCSDDTDCGIGSSCILNHCEWLMDLQGKCKDDTHCPGAQICCQNQCEDANGVRCGTDAHCGGHGAICVQNQCGVKDFRFCGDDSHCTADMVCVNDECMPKGPYCSDSAHCMGELICVHGECQMQEGDSCSVPADCPESACLLNECRHMDGDYCRTDSDCESNVCGANFECVNPIIGGGGANGGGNNGGGANGGGGEVVPPPSPACTSDADCNGGMCIQGDCEANNGRKCLTQANCLAGTVCVDNDCKVRGDQYCMAGTTDCATSTNGPLCIDNECLPADGDNCLSDLNCPMGATCDLATNECVFCKSDADCFAPQVCIDGDCDDLDGTNCRTSADCFVGHACHDWDCFPVAPIL